MAWSFKVEGNGKAEVLLAFDAAVDRQPMDARPAEKLCEIARVMVGHLPDHDVRSITTHGHTAEHGGWSNVSFKVNC
jgi:hypothetical protein